MKTIPEGKDAFPESSERLLTALKTYLAPDRAVVKAGRLEDGLEALVAGMLGVRSRHLTNGAGSAPGQGKASFWLAPRFYRLRSSPNYSQEDGLKALPQEARPVLEHNKPSQGVVAWDRVNLEQV